jgi:UrcA family protein
MLHRHQVFSAAGLICATLLLAPAASFAQTRAIAVQSGDLNLTRDAGKAVLQQRIAHAVDRVCGTAHARTTADVDAYATCSKAARASATTQYDAVIAKAATETKVAGAASASAPVN